MLAALILMVLTIYFYKKGKNILPLLLPMIFVMSIALISLTMKAQQFLNQGNNLLFGLNCILLGLIVWMISEGLLMFRKLKQNS